MDWGNALDIGQGLKNVHTDVVGDWHIDPWGWPELDWAAGRGRAEFLDRLRGTDRSLLATVDVGKPKFGTRPAVILDPLDRLAYQCIIDRLSKRAIGDLAEHAYGWRLPPTSPEAGHYARNDHQWKSYRKRLMALALNSELCLKVPAGTFLPTLCTPSTRNQMVPPNGFEPSAYGLGRVIAAEHLRETPVFGW